MKKTRFLLLLLPFVTLTCSCTVLMPWESYNPSKKGQEEEEVIKYGKHQMFLDTNFEKGFLAIPGGGSQINTGYVPEDRYAQNVALKYGKNKNQPVWTLRQNNDVYNLNDKYCEGQAPAQADGYYIFSDPSKKLIVNPNKGKLYLELDSSIEYAGADRNSNDQWAHLLIASSLSEEVKVSDLESLRLTIDMQMMINQDLKKTKAYDDEMLLYLQLKSGSADETSDKPLWFGIPFYCSNSSAFNTEYARIDTAAGANSGGFIYKFAANKIYSSYASSLVDMNKHSMDIELINYFQRAIECAHNNNFWTHTTLNDLIITDMNFGYELPSQRKIGVEFSNLQLIADYGQPE